EGLYHLDIPFTTDTQIQLFKDAGFKSAKVFWQGFNASIILAYK
ncbi:MAG: class I SAM-dependent methyltransferase, partial [Flavobacterium sp.]|nr:class I SAM-dependent methyltransferase [Flavobacterium sp.]